MYRRSQRCTTPLPPVDSKDERNAVARCPACETWVTSNFTQLKRYCARFLLVVVCLMDTLTCGIEHDILTALYIWKRESKGLIRIQLFGHLHWMSAFCTACQYRC
jgi:hypothetical protein